MDKCLDWYQEEWENNLKVILFAHNSSIQAEYGREPQLLTGINNAIVYNVQALHILSFQCVIDLVFVYCYFCITSFQITTPDVVEVVEPDQNAFEDHIQARTEKDVEFF
jgi:hypothetical protein